MKRFAFLIIGFFSVTACCGQPASERDFLHTLKRVVTALRFRDSATLSKHIDKKTGVYLLYRPGILDTYKHCTTLGFSDSTYPNVPFYDKVKLTTVRYTTLPVFDCEKWTKTGTYVDTTRRDHLLSTIAKNLNKQIRGAVALKHIDEFLKLENNSRRVVIADNEDNEAILYLSLINNKWVLTIIDKVTADCSL